MFANVNLGANRTAKAISVGGEHTCDILDNGKVRCWGKASSSRRLGYGNVIDIGDDETPGSVADILVGGALRVP